MQPKREHPKLAMIRQHVEQKRFAEARAIVNTINHPIAVQLLTQIDEREAQHLRVQAIMREEDRRRVFRWVGAVVVVVMLVVGAAVFLFIQRPNEQNMNATTTMEGEITSLCATAAGDDEPEYVATCVLDPTSRALVVNAGGADEAVTAIIRTYEAAVESGTMASIEELMATGRAMTTPEPPKSE